VSEAIWIAVLSGSGVALLAMATVIVNSVTGDIGKLSERTDRLERQHKRIVTALMELNDATHPDAQNVTRILKPLIENGDDR